VTMSPRRLLTYSHDGFGLGHLRRSLRLASGVVAREDGFSALVATGSGVSHYMRFPPSVDYLKLPSIAKVANERYRARSLGMEEQDIIGLRAEILAGALRGFRPDVLLVDRYPLGIHDELRPGLELLRSEHPSTRIVLGLRDILDDGDTIRSEWRRHRYTDAIEHLYDQVLIYGDRGVYDSLASPASPLQLRAEPSSPDTWPMPW